jgi:uracil-DNA glycosylase
MPQVRAAGAVQRGRGEISRPRPKFAHGAELTIGPWQLLGSYHVSQQNTFTGRLTEPMLDGVLARARAIISAVRS